PAGRGQKSAPACLWGHVTVTPSGHHTGSCSATKCPGETSISFGRYCSASGSSIRFDFRNISDDRVSSGDGNSGGSTRRGFERSIRGSGTGTAEINALV